MPNEVRVKGSAFKSVQVAAETLRGRAFVDEVLGATPGEVGEALRFGGIISSGWYPVAWYRDFYGTIVRRAGQREFAREVGRASTRHDAGTVLRVFFRVLTVPFLLSQGARVFRMFFDGADLTVTDSGPQRARVRWVRCYGFDRVLWLDQIGTCEELFVLHGGRDLEVRVLSGGADGDDEMEIEGRWR